MFRSRDAHNRVQDSQGRWWYQDPASGTWSIWNGQAWQPAPSAAPDIPGQGAAAGRRPNGRPGQQASGSCLLTVVTLVVAGALIVGGLSLVAFDFFSGQQIPAGQGNPNEILKKGGGGLLITILGTLILNGGFKAIITRRAVVEDDWGRRTEKRGCSAILNGLGQLLFGAILLSGGLGLMTLALYQDVLPWLGL